MSNDKGLYDKYIVLEREKVDSLPTALKDAEVDGCFILEPEDDKDARRAIETYIRETDNEQLAQDLREWIAAIEISEL